MNFDNADDNQDLSRYQLVSRREIVTLLRAVAARNQLVRMQANNGADSAVTSILNVDDKNGVVIIDRAPGETTNQRVLESQDLAFETVLDNIRILFSASGAAECLHDDRPALCIAIPEAVIRLQRRDFYRVPVPVGANVRCTIQVTDPESGTAGPVALSLFNVSGGGIAVVDEKKTVPAEIGTVYKNCRIELPGGAVEVTLQLMNARDITLHSGKHIRRLGFMFVNLPNGTLAAIQRYITKLEREQNARATGMG